MALDDIHFAVGSSKPSVKMQFSMDRMSVIATKLSRRDALDWMLYSNKSRVGFSKITCDGSKMEKVDSVVQLHC